MPFIRLADSHTCPLPQRRPDGSFLVVGDVWECGEPFNDGVRLPCTKIYRYDTNQCDGKFWIRVK